MRKTKLSFNLVAQQHGNDGLFARFYRQPGSAILLQKQVSKASIAKIVGVSLPPPLYQGKAGTPTPLKDIFTPILAGPFYVEERRVLPKKRLLRYCPWFITQAFDARQLHRSLQQKTASIKYRYKRQGVVAVKKQRHNAKYR